MSMELVLTPLGHLLAVELTEGAVEVAPDAARAGRTDRLAKAFASSQAEGLFALAAERIESPLAPSLAYWRDFAARYITELCHTPEIAGVRIDEIPPPAPPELAALLFERSPDARRRVSDRRGVAGPLERFGRMGPRQVASNDHGLAGFLKEHAPLWHQVGRVCFHLAENRRDPDYPFAFLATYAPGLTGGARVQYQPLSKALQQYAGAKDKRALVKLLSPVQLASENEPAGQGVGRLGRHLPAAGLDARARHTGSSRKCPFSRRVGFWCGFPTGGRSDLVPAWASRSATRRQKKFDAQGMLDFKVQLALGDEELSEAEWRNLLGRRRRACSAAGPMGRGGPRQAGRGAGPLEEGGSRAEDGLSFIEGMRLLAAPRKDLAPDGRWPAIRSAEWSFVHAGQWLGEMLAELAQPRESRARPGRATTSKPHCGSTRRPASTGSGSCPAWAWAPAWPTTWGSDKTIQVLALFSILKKKSGGKPSLLVLPASLLANWKSEIQRFTPALRGQVRPPLRNAQGLARPHGRQTPPRPSRDADVVLTTYGMLLRQPWMLDVRLATGGP